ncbi:MAG TPA: phytanoyl-CoA dioxygenase family protein [Parachlamydiaceae bacterium]|nr:phytanoyl-CoA dioxygenase family protein [Parachlamydiaceae bacterium]
MIRSCLLLFACIGLFPKFSQAQHPLEYQGVLKEKVLQTHPYLKDLEEQGYCVIPEVLSKSETEILYQRVWKEFVEKAWPNCNMDDRSNWNEVFPMHNKLGIFAGPAGQTQVMWDLRQDPRIVDIFARIWNTSDLIVSMDGLSLMCPPEIREGYFDPWPHVDQAVLTRHNVKHNNTPPINFVSESLLKTHPFTIQGQFLFEDSLEGDGGFYCIPKSHLRFSEFAPQLEALNQEDVSNDEQRKTRDRYIQEFFCFGEENSEDAYTMKHIIAPRGSLILWDSRTIHWNQHAIKNRPQSDKPKVRMVGYICYVPKARLSDEGKNIREVAFKNGVSTGHNPSFPELKYTKDHIWEGFEKYLEDPAYIQPKINLTPLGQKLLNG